MKNGTAKTLVYMGVFIALHVVLSRFLSISTWNLKIGFAFVPLMLCALLLGPVQACIVGALSDFLGAILFPIGPYFPGFTLTVALTGLMYGLVFHKKQSLVRSLIAALLNQGIIGLLFTTYFISVLYGTPFSVLLVTRSIQAGIMFVVEFLVIYFVTVQFGTRIKRALRVEGPKTVSDAGDPADMTGSAAFGAAGSPEEAHPAAWSASGGQLLGGSDRNPLQWGGPVESEKNGLTWKGLPIARRPGAL